MSDPQERMRRGMADILNELEQMYSLDLIGAVQINIALRDGGVRTLRCYDDGFKLMLIAAAAIGQHEALQVPSVERDPENWEAEK